MSQFTDISRINVCGGNGGAGCMSFRREAHVPKGGPDGGDGGVAATSSSRPMPPSSLIDYRFKHHFKAERGTHGRVGASRQNGEDLILKRSHGHGRAELDEDAGPAR